jgi:hypothetical protein
MENDLTPEELTALELAALATEYSLDTNPRRHDTYELTVDYAAEMAPHAFATDPGDLLTQYRPLEDESIHDYRIDIYQPTSYREFKRAQNVVSRIFSEGFFSIQYPRERDALITDQNAPEIYFERNFAKGFKSVVKYAQSVLLGCMLGDPNGVVTVERVLTENEGEFPEILPTVWLSSAVVDFKWGEWVLIETDEMSMVTLGEGDPVPQGIIYRFFNLDEVWEIRQVGRKSDKTFVAEMIDRHNLGELPAMFLGGEIVAKNDIRYFKSFFDAALGDWNKLIREDSDQDGNIVQHSHPQKVLADMPCAVCSGVGYTIDDDQKDVTCKVCKGKGKIVGTSPYRHLSIDASATDEMKPADAIHVVELKTDILEFNEKRLEKHSGKALDALNMQAVLGVNDMNSGKAKQIDRSDLNLRLGVISDRMWDLIEFIYSFGIRLRYRENINASELMPEIMRPVGFDSATMDQLLAESKAARDAGMPSQMIRAIDKKIAEKQHGKGSIAANRIIAGIDLDPYYGQSAEALLAKNAISPGSVSPEWAYISTNMPTLLRMAEDTDSEFFNKSRTDQFANLLSIADAMRGDSGPDPDDPESAAKAKIRGSVGGVEALVKMNAAVAAGQMSRDAAIQVIVQIYGIDESLADDLVDEPNAPIVELPPTIPPIPEA